MYNQTVWLSLPANQDSDIMSLKNIGESDGNWDYVELTKKSPTGLANLPNLVGHISELK